jgi:hypothetical protein
MMPSRLVCAALLAALLGPGASLAQSDAPSLTKDEVTELSGLVVTVKKPDPTPLSGVTVAVRRSPKVSELTVVAPKCPPAQASPDPNAEPPKLLSSFPAPGSTVRGGIVILRLTFDRPMTCEGLLDKIADVPNPCPGPLTDPLFSRDRRTFLTVCVIDKDPRWEGMSSSNAQFTARYGLQLANFTSLSGKPLKARALDFYVNPLAAPVKSVKEAMTQDRFLRDAQKAAEQAP